MSAADEAVLRALAAVPRPHGDARPWVTGLVVAADDTTATVTVDLGGDVPVTLPRVDSATYAPGARVVVLRDPDGSGSGQLVLGPVTVIAAADPLPSRGTVTALTATAVTVTTSAGTTVVAGSIASAVLAVNDAVLLYWDPSGDPWVLGKIGVSAAVPGAPGAPTLDRSGGTVAASWTAVAGATSYAVSYSTNGGTTWAVKYVTGTSTALTIPQGKTLSVRIAARSSGGSSAYSATASVAYPNPTPTTRQYTATIRCTSSGTWRTIRADWDRWNVSRWGGVRDVYQGDAFGSGELVGFAGYGSQLTGLGAISFDNVRLYVKRNGWNGGGSQTVTVQGSPSGSRPSGRPASSGATVTTPAANTEQYVAVDLPASMAEALRTGAARGLVTVGSAPAGWYGTGDSFRLVVTYTRYI